MDELTIPPDQAAEEKREKERIRKQTYRSNQVRKDSKADGHKKRTVPTPADIRDRLGSLKGAADPLSPGEAQRQLYHGAVGLSKIIRSKYDWDVSEFEEVGNATADASKIVWPIRLAIKAIVPLVLVGCFWEIGSKMVTHTDWWVRLQEKREQKKAAKDQGVQLRIVQEAQAQPTGTQPPPPQSPGLQFRGTIRR